METNNLKPAIGQYQLFDIEVWEKANTAEHVFNHIFFTDKSKQVRKVTGTVKIMRKKLVNGIYRNVECEKKVRWDGYGHCFVGTHNLRLRDFDIPLKNYIKK